MESGLQLDQNIKAVPHVFGKEERNQMLAVLIYIRDLFFDDMGDPENPVYDEEELRYLAEKRAKRQRARNNERREERRQGQDWRIK